MITVEVRRAEGRVTGFSVSGHAGFGKRGTDIVCAGVSVLVDTTVLSLSQVAGIPVQAEAGPGRMDCSLPESLDPAAAGRAGLLLETMLLGLKEIARAYPGRLRFVDPAR
ncbi:MAG: ribosomal-processing cysteine protease Prp [Chitinophagales bacterium]